MSNCIASFTCGTWAARKGGNYATFSYRPGCGTSVSIWTRKVYGSVKTGRIRHVIADIDAHLRAAWRAQLVADSGGNVVLITNGPRYRDPSGGSMQWCGWDRP